MPRPSFKPTKEQRKMVKSLAAFGMRHNDIAVVVGLRSPKTLRKHFRKELSLGSAEALATVTRVAYEMATSGKYPDMTDWWLSTMDAPADWTEAAEADEVKTNSKSTCELIFAPALSSAIETPEEVSNAASEV